MELQLKKMGTLKYMKRTHTLLPLALMTTSVLILSGCTGTTSDAQATDDQGFEFGASQEEVNAAIEDLEPVEIVYQGGGQSPNSVTAINDFAFKEYVEERSDGKISVELVWGQAIAGYSEIEDALLDGRIDVAYSVPIYNPDEYVAFDAIAKATSSLPNSPVVGEMVGNATVIELAWGSEDLLAEYEAQGVTPLMPMVSSGTYLTVCADPGTSPVDWRGRTVRVGNTAHEQLAQNWGGTPTSMEYTEVFEALQRGTVDCTLAQMLPSEEAGLLEVASNVSYTSEENSMSGRAAGATLAGSKYQNLPVAYQQIIFDAGEIGFAVSSQGLAEGNVAGVRQIHGAGGEIAPLDDEAEQILAQTNEDLISGIEESGAVDSDLASKIKETAAKWSEVSEELGYTEAGGFEDLDEWYKAEDYDFEPIAERVFEDILLTHRPG